MFLNCRRGEVSGVNKILIFMFLVFLIIVIAFVVYNEISLDPYEEVCEGYHYIGSFDLSESSFVLDREEGDSVSFCMQVINEYEFGSLNFSLVEGEYVDSDTDIISVEWSSDMVEDLEFNYPRLYIPSFYLEPDERARFQVEIRVDSDIDPGIYNGDLEFHFEDDYYWEEIELVVE